MPVKGIVTGQSVQPSLAQKAKELRHAMTPAEQKLWQRLRAGRLEGLHFKRQQIIGCYIVDFYCHQADLVVEVDGGVHIDQQEYDDARSDYLFDRGLRVLRFTNTQVNHQLEEVLAAILDTCRRSRD